MGCQALKLKQAHKKTRESLASLELRCQFYPKCEEIVLYGNLASHEFTCEFNQVKCPNWEQCRALTKKEDLFRHHAECSKLKRSQCESCQRSFPNQIELTMHKSYDCEMDAQSKLQCQYCSSSFTKKAFVDGHFNQCQELTKMLQDLKQS